MTFFCTKGSPAENIVTFTVIFLYSMSLGASDVDVTFRVWIADTVRVLELTSSSSSTEVSGDEDTFIGEFLDATFVSVVYITLIADVNVV